MKTPSLKSIIIAVILILIFIGYLKIDKGLLIFAIPIILYLGIES